MSLNVSMYNDKWRLELQGECWQFEKPEDLLEVQKKMMEFKSKYGKLPAGDKGR